MLGFCLGWQLRTNRKSLAEIAEMFKIKLIFYYCEKNPAFFKFYSDLIFFVMNFLKELILYPRI